MQRRHPTKNQVPCRFARRENARHPLEHHAGKPVKVQGGAQAAHESPHEHGAYWTFPVYTDPDLIGALPERNPGGRQTDHEAPSATTATRGVRGLDPRSRYDE
jgi:hypothetical protein